MKLREAIVKVLENAKRPLSSKEIAECAIKAGFWETTGKTPEHTVAATISVSLRKKDKLFVRIAPDTFALYGRTGPVVELDDPGYV